MFKRREMLSPNPFSLFCAVLLCFPLALVFTISNNSSSLVTPTTTITFITFFPPPPGPPPSPPPPPPGPPPSPPPPPPHSPPPPPPSPPPPPPHSPSPKHITNKPPKTLPKKNSTSTHPTKKKTIKQLPSPPPPPPSSPPPVPPDDRNDIDLFKRASRVKPQTTKGHSRKVAFLFLTTTPLPFAPLWELFFNQSGASGKSQYNVYIHTDPRTKYDQPFTGVFTSRVIPSSKPTKRNTPTLITAARRLLAHALLDDPDNYMLTLLSGTCIPLHSFNFTYTTLTTSNSSFIEILSNETTAWGRYTARGDTSMLPEVPFEEFRVGSQFWSLTRRHARVVVEDKKLWRKFRLPCLAHLKEQCYPEENYFPTLISMVDPHNVVPATLTNVNWRGRHDGHPRTYNGSEVDPGLIRWLREGRPRYGHLDINGSDLFVRDRWDPFLFARKFAPNCVKPLLNISRDFLFKD